ncbi:MAG: hypothetical protein ACW99G_10155 [Candidatus Thorarchaeota archaeon]|jgi:hypothetical protein
MANRIIGGTFAGTKKTYLSKDGLHYFVFDFINKGNYIDVYCKKHPSLSGYSSSPEKTHLFHSGKLCFVSGKQPKTQWRAEQLAAQWAEYFLEYRRTGQVQK